jgi:hypothetical protein
VDLGVPRSSRGSGTIFKSLKFPDLEGLFPVATDTVNTEDDMTAVRERAEQGKNDDLLGAIGSVDYALKQGIIALPITITMPDPPDALILSGGNPVLAVEVRRVTWKRLRHVEAHATPWDVDAGGQPIRGDLIEHNPDLCTDEPARPDKGAPKGSRTGNFRAIKKPGEKLDGDGWVGGEMEAVTLAALQTAVTEKQAKFESYSVSTSHVWLFLIDDGIAGAWESILSNPDLMQQVKAICAASDFERVLLFRFSYGVSELWCRN